MPIKDYHFTSVAGAPARPMLWIRVTNPDTKKGIIALAIVDTGADDCAFPAIVAAMLGHKLKSVPPKEIKTASGTTYAYAHTSRVDILEMRPDGLPGKKILYTIPKTPIDFIQGCNDFLLGTRNFLSKFVVTIDYLRQHFSIRKPKK